jgi:hypothetical protein
MNELVRIESNVEAYRASTEAAALCKEIVVATSSTIQGRRYVSVEGWQAIARAHGCAAGARDVKRVDGGVSATGEVRDIHTGALIASAEGFVGEDEPTWFGGISKSGKTKGQTLPKRDDYAIRAMAQTRAMSRACRSAFAHVVVMMKAGLATTPAEEVPAEGFDAQTGEVFTAEPKVAGIHKIKQDIRKLKELGNEAPNLAQFETQLALYAKQIAALEEAQHSWWTGKDKDGNEFESLPAWIARRREELTPVEMGEIGQMCMDTLAQCTSKQELDGWFKLNWKYVEELDGAERDTVEARYQELEQGFKQLAEVTDGG